MFKKKKLDYLFSAFPLCIILLCFAVSVLIISCKVDAAAAAAASSFDDDDDEEAWDSTKVGPFVPIDQRRSLVSTEYGEISAAKVTDGINGSYYLQFIKLEANALFLPVILHADMVFYVQTGSGRVGLINEENGKKKGAGTRGVDINRGDVYRLPPGTVFFIQSSLEPERQKLRICAIFANSDQDLREPVIGPYSIIRDLVLGFDKKILQAAFQVPEEVVEEITSSKKPLAIVRGMPNSSTTLWEVEAQFVEAFFGRKNYNMFDDNKKKGKLSGYNILTGDRDVQNCNGWSSTVTSKQLRSLGGSSIGIFMVNLTKGAMMGPHWNPMATEIAIVLQGRGMVYVVCPSTASETECKNKRISVEEGDVFVVPRFHPMAQMSFNNDSFVFVGFTTTNRNTHPQFLAGKSSVLQTLDKQVLSESFNVSSSTIGQLLAPQHQSIILECVSCAEEEERLLEEEIEKKKEKARKKKEEEEARKREEEAKKKEEEAKEKEEEEAKEKEEEETKKKEEEEARKREEDEKKRKEQEEARKREEEKRRKEEEGARRKEQVEARQRKERQQQEDEGRRKAATREEEAARQQEEEMEKQQHEEGGGPDRPQGQEETEAKQEEARRKEDEAQRDEKKRRQEAAARKKKEEEAQQEEKGRKEAARQQEEEREGGQHEQQKEKEREKQQNRKGEQGHIGEKRQKLDNKRHKFGA